MWIWVEEGEKVDGIEAVEHTYRGFSNEENKQVASKRVK